MAITPERNKVKAQKGHNDADACLTAPLVLGVADGVSQIEVWRVTPQGATAFSAVQKLVASGKITVYTR